MKTAIGHEGDIISFLQRDPPLIPPGGPHMSNRCTPLIAFALLLLSALPAGAQSQPDPFRRDNLVAWCIVPFDSQKRSPAARAEMLDKLGIRALAYDYRAEHIASFDEELEQLAKHKIQLTAWWFPTTLNEEAKLILKVLEKHNVQTQLWVTGGGAATKSPEEQNARVESEAARIRTIAEAAAKQGCTVALYNHGGWFGEPENQIAIIQRLKRDNITNVGIVYNLHHGHQHLTRFAELIKLMQPYLMALNLNGMVPNGEAKGEKILPLGTGSEDVALLKIIRHSGYNGPIGILNHTDHDAEQRLLDNLEGLDWLLPQVDGKPAAKQPAYRTWQPKPKAAQNGARSHAIKPALDGGNCLAPKRTIISFRSQFSAVPNLRHRNLTTYSWPIIPKPVATIGNSSRKPAMVAWPCTCQVMNPTWFPVKSMSVTTKPTTWLVCSRTIVSVCTSMKNWWPMKRFIATR